jgi:hypothetical protein
MISTVPLRCLKKYAIYHHTASMALKPNATGANSMDMLQNYVEWRIHCAVCAGNRLTIDHQCEVPKCKAGLVCVHGDIKCAACGNLHKVSDHGCPMRIKAS